MNTSTLNKTFDPQTLADDLSEVHRIYVEFFAALDRSRWDTPVKGGPKEWTLHQTIAHLCALNGAGLASIQHTLHGEPYTFVGLEDRYKFRAYNRKGIEDLLDIPMEELFAECLGILEQASSFARGLQPGQAEREAQLPIYNRPVKFVEALGIIMSHAGLLHSAQVAEPAGVPPLWVQLSPEIRHRVIGRMMRAFSLLYRLDIGGPLRTTIAFHIDGPGGGDWHVDLSPHSPASDEGTVEHPGLLIHLRDTATFCRMLTGRLNRPIALISGDMKLRGDLRLFLRMSTLFSEDARPKATAGAKYHPLPST
jgi:hypothetical protein